MEQDPKLSAGPHYRNSSLRLVIIIAALGFAVAAIVRPIPIWTGISIAFSGLVIVKTALKCATIVWPKVSIDAPQLTAWPRFSVLVPLYHEAQMVPQIIKSLSCLDYPHDRLEIVLITEYNDPATEQAVAERCIPPFRHVICPQGPVQTKPFALNHALPECSGEIITVYDAEDHPSANQLRSAVAALAKDKNLAAVQSPLGYYNAKQNWLTRQFALEYNALFRVWNPALAGMGIPYPLGGTSNHIRRDCLDAVGGWDAYNVTEDADLTFKFAAKGWSLGYAGGETWEQATPTFYMWRKQRTRWIKGFMQTWIVNMRTPFAPGGVRGLLRFWSMQLTIGAAVIAALLHVPALIILALLALFTSLDLPWGVIFSVMIPAYVIPMIAAIIGSVRAGQGWLRRSALSMPIYWMAMIIPAYAAVWQLVTNPSYWNKTPHLTRDTLDGEA